MPIGGPEMEVRSARVGKIQVACCGRGLFEGEEREVLGDRESVGLMRDVRSVRQEKEGRCDQRPRSFQEMRGW